MNTLRLLSLSVLIAACTATGDGSADAAAIGSLAALGGGPHETTADTVTPLRVPPESWKSLVSPESYSVLFEEQTEASCSSPLNREKRSGTYICAACYLPLFESDSKFESGTGWPSFFRPIAGHVATREDGSFGMTRTEYHCARCGGHQGHVFDDGPNPTGMRFCTNGLALRFVPSDEPLPALRGGA